MVYHGNCGVTTYTNAGTYKTAKSLFDKDGAKHKPFVKFRRISRNGMRFLSLLKKCRKDTRDKCFAVEVDTAIIQEKANPEDYKKISDAYNYLWLRHTHDYANEYRRVSDYFNNLWIDYRRSLSAAAQ